MNIRKIVILFVDGYEKKWGTKGGICDCNMGKWGTENYQGHGHTAGKKGNG